MHINLKPVYFFLFFVLAHVSYASDFAATSKGLLSSKSLKIWFDVASFGDWDDHSAIAKPESSGMAFIFDSINHKTGYARMIGNQGATDVRVLTTPGPITFIEVTESGTVNTTTVYPELIPGTEFFKAVHSRHIYAGPLQDGGAIPSQHYGFAQTWQ